MLVWRINRTDRMQDCFRIRELVMLAVTDDTEEVLSGTRSKQGGWSSYRRLSGEQPEYRRGVKHSL